MNNLKNLAIVTAALSLAACGGGGGAAAVGGSTGTPSANLTLNTPPSVSMASGSTIDVSGMANSYPRDISSMTWSSTLTSASSGTSALQLANSSCAVREKSSQTTVNGNINATSTCSLNVKAPATSTELTYRLVLTTTDTAGNSASSTTTLVVKPGAATSQLTAKIDSPTTAKFNDSVLVTCLGAGGDISKTGRYSYQIVTTPAYANISVNNNTATFTPNVLTAGKNVLVECRVNDDTGLIATNTSNISVVGSVTAPFVVASIGNVGTQPNSTVSQAETITLDGTSSVYGDGFGTSNNSLFYLWTQTAGPSTPISNARSPIASVSSPTSVSARTQLTYNLAVSNSPISATGSSTGILSTTSVSYYVDPLPAITLSISPDSAKGVIQPRANASIAVTAAGNGTRPVYYKWTQISGIPVTLGGGTTPTANFVAPSNPSVNPVALTFRVAAGYEPITNLTPGSASVDVLVAVAPGGQPQDLAITSASVEAIENKVVTVSSSVTGNAASRQLFYAWKQISGPTVALAGANTSSMSFVAPANASTTALQLMFTVGVSTSPIADVSEAEATVDVVVAVSRAPVQ